VRCCEGEAVVPVSVASFAHSCFSFPTFPGIRLFSCVNHCCICRCGGAVELVDLSDQLPGFVRLPGTHTWTAFDNQMESYTSFDDAKVSIHYPYLFMHAPYRYRVCCRLVFRRSYYG
jgi:hypothetical protein